MSRLQDCYTGAILSNENQLDEFAYRMGGLFVNAVKKIYPALHQDIVPEEYTSFVCPAEASMADIQICMEYSSEPYFSLSGSDVFSDQYLKVQAVIEGVCVLRYRHKQQTPYLTVQADHYFSRFQYCFYPDSLRISGSNISYRAAADSFLLHHSFINSHGLIIHAGGGTVQGKGIILAGTSGAGKSTLSELLSASTRNRLFSDERLVVRFSDDRWNVWGTPWMGTGNIARNETAPLSALFFLKQAEKTHVTALTPSQGLHRLLQVASIPWYSAEWTNKGLAVCESLIQDIPMFELAFRPDQTAVQAVEHFVAAL